MPTNPCSHQHHRRHASRSGEAVHRASGVPHELRGEHHTGGEHQLNDGPNVIRDGQFIMRGRPRVNRARAFCGAVLAVMQFGEFATHATVAVRPSVRRRLK